MNKIQQYKEILGKAPEGATHIDLEDYYIKFSNGNYYCTQVFGVWRVMDKAELTTGRALSDLQTIVEQAETIERLKSAIKQSVHERNEPYDYTFHTYCNFCDTNLTKSEHEDDCILKELNND